MISCSSLPNMHILSHRYRRRIKKMNNPILNEDKENNYNIKKETLFLSNNNSLSIKSKYSSSTYTFLYFNNIKINK